MKDEDRSKNIMVSALVEEDGEQRNEKIGNVFVEIGSPGSNGQNRPFSAEGPMAKQIIGRDSIVYKEAGTVLKFDKYLISHVIVTCAF